jgi:hypothetical protein|tara:strand:- start:116 stop:529 length:414 start_codon:yes stop_codon:yes gene_type:complete
MTEYTKPLPRGIQEEANKPFWDAARRHELVMPRCKNCDHMFFYPRTECPKCMSSNLDWTQVSGKGRLYAFTLVRQPVNPAFRDDVPYAYAMVQLAEGPRMISNIVECDVEALEIDMPLEAVFDDVTPECTLVKFKPS